MQNTSEFIVDMIFYFSNTMRGRSFASETAIISLAERVLQKSIGAGTIDPPMIKGCAVKIVAHCPITRNDLAIASLEDLAGIVRRYLITECIPCFGLILVDLCCVTYTVLQGQ